MFSFHHVALSVSDTIRSKEFYAKLGFKPVFEWIADDKSLTITHLALGATILELFCYREPVEQPLQSLENDLRHIGIKHFGLRVEVLENAQTFITASGIAAGQDIMIKQGRTGIKYFFIRDPDGNFVEIVEDHRNLNLF